MNRLGVPEQKLNQSDWKVLVSIIAMASEGKPITVRMVNGRAGHKSLYTTHLCLRRLRESGLVTVEPGLSGTIRPAVEFIPAEQIP